MSYKRFPIFLDLRNKNVLIVGGGHVAVEKVRQLLASEPSFKIVAPEISEELRQISFGKSRVRIENRDVQLADFNHVDLVILATNHSELNRWLAREARNRNLWVNSVDDPSQCDFFTASIIDYETFRFAISSDGHFPGMTRLLRRVIEELLPKKHLKPIQALADFRKNLKQQLPNEKERFKVLRNVLKILEFNYFKKEDKTLSPFIEGDVQ